MYRKSYIYRYGTIPNPGTFKIAGDTLTVSHAHEPQIDPSMLVNEAQKQQDNEAALDGMPEIIPSADLTYNPLYPMTLDEQLRTLFVGNVPVEMPDSLFQTAVQHIPGLEHWVRFRDPNGKPEPFGFLRYKSPAAIKAALQILPNVVLRDKNLVVGCEENTMRWLESQEPISIQAVARRSAADLERIILNTFAAWSQATAPQVVDEKKKTEEESDSDVENPEESVMELYNRSLSGGDDLGDIPADEREGILKEIKRFRQLSIKFEKARLAADERYGQQRQNEIARASQRELNGDINTAERELRREEREMYRFPSEDDLSDEEDLVLEESRRMKEQEREDRLYEERKRRWLNRERTRASALEREIARDESREDRMNKDKQAALRRYAEFDDDDDQVRKAMLYYYDHATWVKDRLRAREREIEHDKADAIAEEQEIESEVRANPSFFHREAETAKISLSLGAKKQPTTTTTAEINLPSTKQELFAWPVKWEVLDKNQKVIIDDRLKPVVVDNIIEYLGVQEDELIEFIIQHVKEHKSPESLLKELEETLDEDAEVVVERVWQTLVKETES
ncbi:hypothetical protein TRVA0_002S02234 [Trichomonascus vanleenenianus]|uniref:Snu71p n=1 Tax=Trichomonascus vanleenenianus TaxID=2268995 RepID=UPI003ECB7D15